MAKMQATIDWLGKVRFEGVSGSGHRLAIDGPPELGGEDEGIRPMELMLLGVGGCTSFDVVNILHKSREDITGCVAEIEAERAETEPKVFTRVHLHFRVAGRSLNPGKVERALKLSAEKYCSAAIMLERAGVAVSHDFELIDDDATAARSPRDSADAESPVPGGNDATAEQSSRDPAGAASPSRRDAPKMET